MKAMKMENKERNKTKLKLQENHTDRDKINLKIVSINNIFSRFSHEFERQDKKNEKNNDERDDNCHGNHFEEQRSGREIND